MNSEDPFIRVRRCLVDEARALLRDKAVGGRRFSRLQGLERDLAGDEGLEGFDLDVFQRLEAWERAVGADKEIEEGVLRARLAQFIPPDACREPTIAWVVEYSDPREPGANFQAGAFTTEAEARRLLDQLKPDTWRTDLRVNMIPVHETLEAWEWDR